MQKRARKVHPKNEKMPKKTSNSANKMRQTCENRPLSLAHVWRGAFAVFNCSFWNMVLKKAIMLCKVRFILILIKIHVANLKLPSLPTSSGKIRTANHDAFPSWFRFHSQLKIHSELNKFTNASQHHQCQRKMIARYQWYQDIWCI